MIKMKYTSYGLHKNEEVKFHTFSGGEVHTNFIGHVDTNSDIILTARLDSSDEIMKLFILTDALRRNHENKIELEMPYIPYARQDRACVKGDAFSLKAFADLINLQKYSKVTVMDSHSLVATALINNVYEITQSFLAYYFMSYNKKVEYDYLISPDAGASKKTSDFAKTMDKDIEVIQSLKVRDKLGDIVSTNVLYNDFQNKNCLIVDDICDGGRTFIELAKILKSKNANNIGLFVTHGIFSQGIDVLYDNEIDQIFTTDSFKQDDPRVNVIYRTFFENNI